MAMKKVVVAAPFVQNTVEYKYSLAILGYYDTLVDLAAAVTAPAVGDVYGVGTVAPYTIYIWDGTSWVDNGTLKGEKGDTGEPGADGADGDGAGDVVGPASATGDNFAAFDGVTGKLLKDLGKKASDFLGSLADDTTPELTGALDCNQKPVYWDLHSISGTEINIANGNKQKLTLSTTNITVTLTTPSGACAFHLFIYQGATARTITWPTIKWLGGTAPDLNVSNGRFVVCLAWDGTSWFGSWGAYS